MARTRILLADDHQEIRDFVAQLLEQDFEVVQTVGDGGAFLEAASKLNPDLCVLDISMPIVNGLEAMRQLKQRGCIAKIIILTVHEDQDFVRVALQYGASGYVFKSRLARDLVLAIRLVLTGRTFISSEFRLDTLVS